MEWRRLSDGSLRTQANGVSLALDPLTQTLRVVVTDYHSTPVEVDFAELCNLLSGTEPPRSAPLCLRPRFSRAQAVLSRFRDFVGRHAGSAVVTGAMVAVIAHAWTRRR